MQKSKLSPTALLLLIFLAVAVLSVVLLVSSCSSKDNDVSIESLDSSEYILDYTQPTESTIAFAATPCDSVYYEPVAFGSQLRVLKNTISHGNRRGVIWWQCKSFAWQLIQPTKYQQDSTKERVVFADIDTIGYGDTFYICRKKKL